MRSTLVRCLSLILLVFAVGCADGDGRGATVIGTLESGLGDADPRVEIELDGEPRAVPVFDDDFAAEGLPPGDVTVAVEADGIRGEITVDDVRPGEVIQVSVRRIDGGIVIRVERRVRPRNPLDPHDHAHERHRDDDIVLRSSHIKYDLPAGVHDGDLIIDGDHIKVKGRGCATVITGDLIIRGDHIQVKYVRVLGRVRMARGTEHVKIKEAGACPHRHHDHHHDHHDRDDDHHGDRDWDHDDDGDHDEGFDEHFDGH